MASEVPLTVSHNPGKTVQYNIFYSILNCNVQLVHLYSFVFLNEYCSIVVLDILQYVSVLHRQRVKQLRVKRHRVLHDHESIDLGSNDKRSKTRQRVKRQMVKSGEKNIMYYSGLGQVKTISGPNNAARTG